MEKLNAAVFGLGNVGINYDLKNNYFKTHIKTLNKKRFFKVNFSVDRDINQLNLVNKYYKIKTFKKIKDCPNIKLQLAVVCLPTLIHFKACKMILNKFKPNVLLLEKPGCNSLNELEKINRICKKNKCYLAINYIRRFDPKIIEIKKKYFTKKNIYKNFKYANIYYNGSLKNTCSHYINLLNFLIDDFNHKKIKIIKNKKNFIIEKNFSHQKEKKRFLFFKNENLKNDEIKIVFKNYTINYNNKYGNFKIVHRKKIKLINTNLKNYQNSVYNVIFKYLKSKKNKINSNYEDAAITHKLLRKL